MPRGSVGGATAALIHALAEVGVHVSVFQIERWRASGELPRPVRHGRGRGRGVFSDPPDSATVQTAFVLAKSTRRGSRRFGAHPVERVALRLPVPEPAVRRATGTALDRVAQVTAADIADPDQGWQARQDAANQAAREPGVFTWQQMVEAADEAPSQPEAPPATRRAAFAGLIHAVGGGEESLPEDLAAMLGMSLRLAPKDVEALLRDQVDAELRGERSWSEPLAQHLSVHHMRRVTETTSFDVLQRAIQVVADIATWQTVVILFGMPDLVGEPLRTGSALDRFDGAMIRQLQNDPMWTEVNAQRLIPRPRHRVNDLVLSAVGLLISGRLPGWEAYRDRLLQITSPASVARK